jgi:hypothetical protein
MSEKGVQLNWAGQRIRPGEPYGGRAEFLPDGSPPVLGAPGDAPKRDRREVICEHDVAGIFGNGPLTKAEAAKKLSASTGASRANMLPCSRQQRALRWASAFRKGNDHVALSRSQSEPL